MAGDHQKHPGGGFNPPEPTTKGGPDYGRFIDAVRELQDHARAVDAPDDVITEAADMLSKVSTLAPVCERPGEGGSIFKEPDAGWKVLLVMVFG